MIHVADTEFYVSFGGNGKPLEGTLRDRELGRIKYSVGAKARTNIKVRERDLKVHKFPKKGLLGFVALKRYGLKIANEITANNSTEISL